MRKNILALYSALLIFSAGASAHDFVLDSICYNIISEIERTCEVTFCNSENPKGVYRKFYKGTVSVPETVTFGGKVYTVTTIGQEAFSNNDELQSVILPKTIVAIESRAFSHCPKFNSLILPENVKEIDNWAFCSLPSLEHLSVDENNNHFDSREDCNAIIKTNTNTLCVGCKSTIIPNSVTVIAGSAFLSCFVANGEIKPFELKIPASVEIIQQQAFNGCTPLSAVTFSEGLRRIGDKAFAGTAIKKVVIPATVKEIDATAFQACDSLSTIKVKRGNKVYHSRKKCNAIIEKESEKLLLGCTYSTIPKGVKIIGRNAFAKSRIKEVKFPSTLQTIETSAFFDCSDLKNILVPGNVKEIKGGAFFASGIKTVVIEEGVEKIGSGAFKACTYLECASLPASLTEITNGNYAGLFTNCNKLQTVNLNKDNKNYYCNGHILLDRATNTIIDGWSISKCYAANGPAHLQAKKIGREAFRGHDYMSYVLLPESVEEIGARAFYDCKGLRVIECRATVPPTLAESVFVANSGSHDYALPLQQRAVLVVPKGSLIAYKRAPGWKEFKHIVESK